MIQIVLCQRRGRGTIEYQLRPTRGCHDRRRPACRRSVTATRACLGRIGNQKDVKERETEINTLRPAQSMGRIEGTDEGVRSLPASEQTSTRAGNPRWGICCAPAFASGSLVHPGRHPIYLWHRSCTFVWTLHRDQSLVGNISVCLSLCARR